MAWHTHAHTTHTWMGAEIFYENIHIKVCIFSSFKWGGTKRMNVFTIITEVNTIMRFSFCRNGDPQAELDC